MYWRICPLSKFLSIPDKEVYVARELAGAISPPLPFSNVEVPPSLPAQSLYTFNLENELRWRATRRTKISDRGWERKSGKGKRREQRTL